MDMSKGDNSNAILIAISAILQGNNSVAELSELISKIILDIKEDGILDGRYLNILKNNSEALNLFEIRENLENRYRALGLNITIPYFEKYAKRLVSLSVTSTIPNSNDDRIDRNTDITVKFNKPIDESTISNNSFVVNNGISSISGSFDYNELTYEVIFSADKELQPSTTYSISINNNLKGIDGIALATGFSFSFISESLDIESNLINYYQFSGDFNDGSGNNNDATGYDGVFIEDRFGNVNSAYKLDNHEDYIEIPRLVDVRDSEWTYSIWFKLNTLPSQKNDVFLLTRKDVDYSSDILLYVDNDDNAIKVAIVDGHYKMSSGVVVNLNTWYCASVTNSENGIKLYVNGENKNSTSIKFTNNLSINEPFILSGKYVDAWGDDLASNGSLIGDVDDIRIYNRCLNNNEMKLLFNDEQGKSNRAVSQKTYVEKSFVDGVERSSNGNWP